VIGVKPSFRRTIAQVFVDAGREKLPSVMTPADDVIVDAYYVISYDAIVNQCWDLYRVSSTCYSMSISKLLKVAPFVTALLTTATFSLLLRALEDVMKLCPCFLVLGQQRG
jgi:hypothetical protein